MAASLTQVNAKAVARRSNTGRWPTRPEDLMPFGPRQLIDSIIMWSKFLPSMLMLSFANLCIHYCGSLIIPHAIDSPLTRHVIDAGRKLFDFTWTSIYLPLRSQTRLVKASFTAQIQFFLHHFEIFYQEQLADKQAQLLSGYELKAIQVFSLLAYLANDPRLPLDGREAVVASLATRGFDIYRLMCLYIDPLPNVLLYPGICEEDTRIASIALSRNNDVVIPELVKLHAEITAGRELTGEENKKYKYLSIYAYLARQTFMIIRYKRATLQCSGRDCSNSIHSTGKTFQRCSRCRVALYCSKTCQVEAWNADQFPHKTLCKIVRKVCDAVGTDILFKDISASQAKDSKDDVEALVALVTEKWRQAGIPPLDLFEISSWASYKMYSPALPEKRGCEPGYVDYDEKLAELNNLDGALKAKSISSAELTTVHEYLALKEAFSQENVNDFLVEIGLAPRPVAAP